MAIESINRRGEKENITPAKKTEIRACGRKWTLITIFSNFLHKIRAIFTCSCFRSKKAKGAHNPHPTLESKPLSQKTTVPIADQPKSDERKKSQEVQNQKPLTVEPEPLQSPTPPLVETQESPKSDLKEEKNPNSGTGDVEPQFKPPVKEESGLQTENIPDKKEPQAPPESAAILNKNPPPILDQKTPYDELKAFVNNFATFVEDSISLYKALNLFLNNNSLCEAENYRKDRETNYKKISKKNLPKMKTKLERFLKEAVGYFEKIRPSLQTFNTQLQECLLKKDVASLEKLYSSKVFSTFASGFLEGVRARNQNKENDELNKWITALVSINSLRHFCISNVYFLPDKMEKILENSADYAFYAAPLVYHFTRQIMLFKEMKDTNKIIERLEKLNNIQNQLNNRNPLTKKKGKK